MRLLDQSTPSGAPHRRTGDLQLTVAELRVVVEQLESGAAVPAPPAGLRVIPRPSADEMVAPDGPCYCTRCMEARGETFASASSAGPDWAQWTATTTPGPELRAAADRFRETRHAPPLRLAAEMLRDFLAAMTVPSQSELWLLCDMLTASLAADDAQVGPGAAAARRAPTDAMIDAALHGLKMAHLVVEDCWYSCPLATHTWRDGSACCNDALLDNPTCNCGADAHNAKVEALRAALAAQQESL